MDVPERLKADESLQVFVDGIKNRGFSSSEDFIWLGLGVAFRLGIIHEQTEQLRKLEEKADARENN